MIPPLCPMGPIDQGDGYSIDGVEEGQHCYVEGQSYIAPNPETGDPARWEPLICEKCGAISTCWVRLQAPVWS